jgi:hypothetical protein
MTLLGRSAIASWTGQTAHVPTSNRSLAPLLPPQRTWPPLTRALLERAMESDTKHRAPDHVYLLATTTG